MKAYVNGQTVEIPDHDITAPTVAEMTSTEGRLALLKPAKSYHPIKGQAEFQVRINHQVKDKTVIHVMDYHLTFRGGRKAEAAYSQFPAYMTAYIDDETRMMLILSDVLQFKDQVGNLRYSEHGGFFRLKTEKGQATYFFSKPNNIWCRYGPVEGTLK